MDKPNRLAQWRRALRNALLVQRTAISNAHRRLWSSRITQLLAEGFPALRSHSVSFYWPFQGEFDPRFAIRRLRRLGATAALPVVLQRGSPLQFREWHPGVRVSSGAFDLPVPQGTAVVFPQALLIPPIGFDLQGYRLGYGGGYFDRTLGAWQVQPLKIGVAFELSRIETIDPQPWDIPMDFIVTESGIYCRDGDGRMRVQDAAQAAQRSTRILRDRVLAAVDGGVDRQTPNSLLSVVSAQFGEAPLRGA